MRIIMYIKLRQNLLQSGTDNREKGNWSLVKMCLCLKKIISIDIICVISFSNILKVFSINVSWMAQITDEKTKTLVLPLDCCPGTQQTYYTCWLLWSIIVCYSIMKFLPQLSGQWNLQVCFSSTINIWLRISLRKLSGVIYKSV